MTHFILYDLEYTAWENVGQTLWMEGTQRREIIQIGALKVDRDTLHVQDHFNVLVKPTINPQLSDFIQKLTGITQADVDANGLSFDTALKQFSDFCGDAVVYAYGNDAFILGENVGMNRCHVYGALGRRGSMEFASIAPFFHNADPSSKQSNSGRLWQHFGLEKPHDAEEHDALFDCYSILVALRHLVAQGHRLPY